MTAPDANLLHLETSPYLLQHADNPVHWRPWGRAALEEAAATGKPILLSVGYAACHWCHVMAHESFENPETAARMNRLFVNIKVDREERPDIDHLYMTSLHALGERGGWPLTMFLTPQGEPFWGGTYYPPEPRWGRPSFQQVMEAVTAAFRDKPEVVAKNVGVMRRNLALQSAAHPGQDIGPATLEQAGAMLLDLTDPIDGGLKGAPKFPNPPIFRFLWQHACRANAQAASDAVHLLLERMSQGGIYDHLGGGYARYSTDAEWLVPHFEKMLYDNAQILELLALAYAARPDPLYAARAAETVAWMIRDMAAAPAAGHAAFAASEDADSEGEEGRFYVWTAEEINALLGAAAPPFRKTYDVSRIGNWEGKTILRRVLPPGTASEEEALARSRATLFAARAQRVRPGRDDKVLADWNGLAIAALCRAGTVFGRPDWIARAAEAADALHAALSTADGRIAHAWRLGRVTAAGLLEDQAATARATLALFEATGDACWLDRTRRLVAAAEAWFGDADGSYYTTATDSTDVPLADAARLRIATDNVTPNGNGMMAELLARLWHLTGETAFRDRARAVITAFSGLGSQLANAPTLLGAADLLEDGACVVIVGAPGEATAQALLATALGAPDPAICVVRAPSAGTLAAGHPAYGKMEPGAYVCRAGVCGLPTPDPGMLSAMLHRSMTDR